jgi:hypothetical protein
MVEDHACIIPEDQKKFPENVIKSCYITLAKFTKEFLVGFYTFVHFSNCIILQ